MTETIKDMQKLADVLNLSPAAAAELTERLALVLRDTDIDLPDLLQQAMAAHGETSANAARHRVPGRFKGKFVVGPAFFEPLSAADLRELDGE